MKSRKPKVPRRKAKPASQQSKQSGNWAFQYKSFTLPTFRSPLDGEQEIRFKDETDHAFFLRCCELYRVLDLLERTTEKLIEVYSKYRNRDPFKETLTFRYFDSEEALVAKFDPRLAANMFALFNLIYELRMSLTYTDLLPLTVKKEIDDAMLTLRDNWNQLRDGVEERYGWQFKRLIQPELP